jgi:Xaa-Pro aminopeptidase
MEIARRQGSAALLVGMGADLRYLTGHAGPLLERLTMLVVPVDGAAFLVVPRLELPGARQSPAGRTRLVELVPWDETDHPASIIADRLSRSGSRTTDGSPQMLVSDQLWAMHLLALQAVLPSASFGLATTVLRELRMVKDAAEVALLRAAAQAADRVVDQIAAGRLVGRTEAEVSREVRERLVAEGHETADFAVVGSGPNSASPHHEASDRVIRAGDPIVLDIGGTMHGYCSDTTRTLWVTGGDPGRGPDPEFLVIHDLVRRAQAAAVEAVRPGVACERIDAVAREIITEGGHGPEFIHRVGHGIGLETHEEPYMVNGNPEPIREGFAFSVEPGIYLDGRYGARIEDIVVCGPDGAVVLNQSSRDLRVVEG